MLNTLAAAVIGAVLYRLRGGWFKTLTGSTSTHISRAIWAVPSALFISLLLTDWKLFDTLFQGDWKSWFSESSTLTFGLLAVSFFASMALIGHGSHMVYGLAYFRHVNKPTELLTTWWLEKVFGGTPGVSWSMEKIDAFNMVGMSFIGLVRNALAMLPVILHPAAWIYVATGALHGPLYKLGWRFTPDIRAAELFVGAVSWLTLALVFG